MAPNTDPGGDPVGNWGRLRQRLRSSLIGRYFTGEPVPAAWKRLFDISLWMIAALFTGDSADGSLGKGSGDARGETHYRGGSCACGSTPRFCGQFPKCRWKPRTKQR